MTEAVKFRVHVGGRDPIEVITEAGDDWTADIEIEDVAEEFYNAFTSLDRPGWVHLGNTVFHTQSLKALEVVDIIERGET